MRRWFPGTTPRGWDLRRTRPWAWPFPGTRPVAPRASVVDRFVIRGDARLTEPRLRQPRGGVRLVHRGAPLSLELQEGKDHERKAEPRGWGPAWKRAPGGLARSSPSHDDARTRVTWAAEAAREPHCVLGRPCALPLRSPAHATSSLRLRASNRGATRTSPRHIVIRGLS